jgi:hypothetical protein
MAEHIADVYEQPYQVRLFLSEEERQLLIVALPEGSELRRILETLRDRTKGTAGEYEFRGLFCKRCNAHTSHRKRYKSNDRLACDECGVINLE